MEAIHGAQTPAVRLLAGGHHPPADPHAVDDGDGGRRRRAQHEKVRQGAPSVAVGRLCRNGHILCPDTDLVG